jgi:hypothetical protein
MGRQQRMENALSKGGRSGHRHKWNAYARMEKNEENFVIIEKGQRYKRSAYKTRENGKDFVTG